MKGLFDPGFNPYWFEFYRSDFKYRPPKQFVNGKIFYKCNKRSWAKQ